MDNISYRKPLGSSLYAMVISVVVFLLLSNCHAFDPNIPRDIVEERECIGTANGFSISGTDEMHYGFLRNRYLGCTYVLGNLEITFLSHPGIAYDLSFLKNIRYVSGYVLIALVGEVEEIPLTSLEIIRGNDTFALQGKEHSLMVVLTARSQDPTHGLKTLMMPKLKEISTGQVSFIRNPALGFIDTIDWNLIVKGRTDAVHFENEPYDPNASNQTDVYLCDGGGMWGNDESLCQEIYPSPPCDEKCGTLCYGSSPTECCHETCAIGCNGPKAEDCSHCRDFQIGQTCVSYCPDFEYYSMMQDCIVRDPPKGRLPLI